MLEFADELCEFIESCKRLEICLVEETYQYLIFIILTENAYRDETGAALTSENGSNSPLKILNIPLCQ